MITNGHSHRPRGGPWLNVRVPGTRSLPRTSRWRTYLPRRWWIWIIVGALVGVLGWIGVRGLLAKAELETAQTLIGQLKTEALAFDTAGAQATLEQVEGHTRNAVALTSDPMWQAFGLIPVLGTNFTAASDLAAAAQSVVSDVATPLMDVLSVVDPASLAPKDGAIDLQPFIDAIPAVAEANSGAQAAVASVDAINTDGALPQVVEAKQKVASLLDGVAPLLQTLDTVLPLIPPAMGSEGPRTYIVMFQNNAEPRALGGTALSFAVVRMDQGRIQLERTVAAGFENFTAYEFPVVAVPDGAFDIYPGDAYGKFIANATVRPSFPTAAEITQEMWLRQFGYAADGVISIDPVALSYVLAATGPITLSTGDILSSETLVPLLLNQIYQRYNSGNVVADNAQQDVIYGEAVSATFARLTSGPLDPTALFGALQKGLTERRILLWSTREAETVEIAKGGLGGELPVSDDATERVGVYFQDNVGSKMGFYLTQTVRLAQATCGAEGFQNYRVSVELKNNIPPESVPALSPSILGAYEKEELEPGVQRMIVLLYAPPGSRIVGATVDGAPVQLQPLHDEAYPVGKVVISIAPGATGTLSYDLVSAEPVEKKLEAQITPMVTPTVVVADEPLDCATVPAS